MLKSFYQSPYFAYVVLAFGILCIGFSAIFVKIAHVPGSVSTFYRLLFAAIAIVPVWLIKSRVVPGKKDLFLIFIGALFFAIDLFLWNTAILLTSAATATLLANNAPVWVGLISLLVFKERLPAKFWWGLFISMIGLNVLIGIEALQNMSFNTGDLLSLVAGFFYALYILYTMEVRKRVDTISFMTFSVLFMVAMLFLVNLFSGNPFSGFTRTTWFSLMGLGLISHFGGWIAINYALGHLKGANVSVTLLSQALVTAVFGILILGEALTVYQIVGGLLILMGVYVVNRRHRK